MVYGLVFATFLTLILVPVMYAMNKRSIDVLDRYKTASWAEIRAFPGADIETEAEEG